MSQIGVGDSAKAIEDEGYTRWVCPNPWRLDPTGMSHCGRHFARTIHAFSDRELHKIITSGAANLRVKARRKSHGDKSESLTRKPISELGYKIFKGLNRIIPNFESELQVHKKNKWDLRCITGPLTKGSQNVKMEDYYNLKCMVVEWIQSSESSDDSPLLRNSKEMRGFRHDITGSLLCPVTFTWNSRNKQILEYTEGQIIAEPWPIFIYKNKTYNPLDPWDGLLQSDLMLKAYRDIFIVNACACGEHEVTLASVVYTASLLQFALSSTPVMASIKAGESRICGFYDSLLQFLEHPAEKDRATALLLHWKGEFDKMQVTSGSGSSCWSDWDYSDVEEEDDNSDLSEQEETNHIE